MFAPEIYAERRARLADSIGGGLILLPGNRLSPMNYPDNTFEFRQDGTFRYYFGLDRPDLVGTIDADTAEATLFGRESTLDDAVWSGPQPALVDLGASVGVHRTAAPGALRDEVAIASGADRSIHFLPQYRAENRIEFQELLGFPASQVDDHASRALMQHVVSQRLVKTAAEVAEIERAVEVARSMHEYAMRLSRPGLVEREVAGLVRGIALAAGGDVSFPIIFSIHGEILHNHGWDNEMTAGRLIVHDSGAVTDSGYCSDITRTLPVSGRFEPRQRDVYEAVLAAQEAAIDAMAPGVPYREVHLLAARVLTEAFVEIGLLRGAPEDIVEAGAHALFFPHGLGHMLGIDVHDCEAISEDLVGYGEGEVRSEQFGLSALRLARPLQPGWVVTVEPGAYFIPPLIRQWRADGLHTEFVDYDGLDAWMDFGGVRIEDDVLITADACRILGPPIAKRPADVEAVMAEPAE